MCNCRCHDDGNDRPRRRPVAGIVRLLLNVAILWVVLVFGGGTLQQVGHPIAQEVGRIMHVVTFIEPTIYWADGSGHEHLSRGLQVLAHGIPIDRIG